MSLRQKVLGDVGQFHFPRSSGDFRKQILETYEEGGR